MTTERNLWLATHAGECITRSADTCDCGQDLYQTSLSHCPRCGVALAPEKLGA